MANFLDNWEEWLQRLEDARSDAADEPMHHELAGRTEAAEGDAHPHRDSDESSAS